MKNYKICVLKLKTNYILMDFLTEAKHSKNIIISPPTTRPNVLVALCKSNSINFCNERVIPLNVVSTKQ